MSILRYVVYKGTIDRLHVCVHKSLHFGKLYKSLRFALSLTRTRVNDRAEKFRVSSEDAFTLMRFQNTAI